MRLTHKDLTGHFDTAVSIAICFTLFCGAFAVTIMRRFFGPRFANHDG